MSKSPNPPDYMWPRPPRMCPDCGARLQSKRPGEFVSCGCPTECFVDQTPHYERYGGHKKPVEWDPEL